MRFSLYLYFPLIHFNIHCQQIFDNALHYRLLAISLVRNFYLVTGLRTCDLPGAFCAVNSDEKSLKSMYLFIGFIILSADALIDFNLSGCPSRGLNSFSINEDAELHKSVAIIEPIA